MANFGGPQGYNYTPAEGITANLDRVLGSNLQELMDKLQGKGKDKDGNEIRFPVPPQDSAAHRRLLVLLDRINEVYVKGSSADDLFMNLVDRVQARINKNAMPREAQMIESAQKGGIGAAVLYGMGEFERARANGHMSGERVAGIYGRYLNTLIERVDAVGRILANDVPGAMCGSLQASNVPIVLVEKIINNVNRTREDAVKGVFGPQMSYNDVVEKLNTISIATNRMDSLLKVLNTWRAEIAGQDPFAPIPLSPAPPRTRDEYLLMVQNLRARVIDPVIQSKLEGAMSPADFISFNNDTRNLFLQHERTLRNPNIVFSNGAQLEELENFLDNLQANHPASVTVGNKNYKVEPGYPQAVTDALNSVKDKMQELNNVLVQDYNHPDDLVLKYAKEAAGLVDVKLWGELQRLQAEIEKTPLVYVTKNDQKTVADRLSELKEFLEKAGRGDPNSIDIGPDKGLSLNLKVLLEHSVDPLKDSGFEDNQKYSVLQPKAGIFGGLRRAFQRAQNVDPAADFDKRIQTSTVLLGKSLETQKFVVQMVDNTSPTNQTGSVMVSVASKKNGDPTISTHHYILDQSEITKLDAITGIPYRQGVVTDELKKALLRKHLETMEREQFAQDLGDAKIYGSVVNEIRVKKSVRKSIDGALSLVPLSRGIILPDSDVRAASQTEKELLLQPSLPIFVDSLSYNTASLLIGQLDQTARVTRSMLSDINRTVSASAALHDPQLAYLPVDETNKVSFLVVSALRSNLDSGMSDLYGKKTRTHTTPTAPQGLKFVAETMESAKSPVHQNILGLNFSDRFDTLVRRNINEWMIISTPAGKAFYENLTDREKNDFLSFSYKLVKPGFEAIGKISESVDAGISTQASVELLGALKNHFSPAGNSIRKDLKKLTGSDDDNRHLQKIGDLVAATPNIRTRQITNSLFQEVVDFELKKVEIQSALTPRVQGLFSSITNEELSELDSQRDTVLDNLAQFKRGLEAEGLPPHVQQELLDLFVERLHHPGTASQRSYGTCGAGAILAHVRYNDPGEWSRIVTQLILDDYVILRDGRRISCSPSDFTKDVSGRNAFDALLQTAVMQAVAPPGHDYDVAIDGFRDRVTGVEVAGGTYDERAALFFNSVYEDTLRRPFQIVQGPWNNIPPAIQSRILNLGSEEAVYVALSWPSGSDSHALLAEGFNSSSGEVEVINPHGPDELKSNGDILTDGVVRRIISNSVGKQGIDFDKFKQHFQSAIVRL